jgi:hypothetical protein
MSTIREPCGDDVAARDGIVGSVADVHFDDERWAVRFLVVDTGGPGPRSLVEQGDDPRPLCSGTEVIGYGIEARDGAIGDVLTREQVKLSGARSARR